VDAHTDHIDVDHHELIHSDTTLIVYGKTVVSGTTYSNAFSASLPCQISLLHGHLIALASLVENHGKL